MKILVLVIVLILICQIPVVSQTPLSVPAIKSWEPKGSFFILNKDADIVVDAQFSNIISEVAKTFQEDVKYLKNIDLRIENGMQSSAGSLFLTIDTNLFNKNIEAYKIEISDRIIIKANTAAGVFYATRTILQYLKQSDSIPCGIAMDFPDYKERGLMIDNGRKYFSVDWLKNMIRELSYIKMNLLHLHITEHVAFRLECDTYPFLTSNDHYKKSELIELQEFAKKYFITIVPEIDMPNHMSSIVKYFPETHVVDALGQSIGDCCIDITKTESREIIKNILEEYLPIFKGPYWHLGADEFTSNIDRFPQFQKYAQEKYGQSAQGKDAFIDFINWVDSIVVSHGKTLRIWNDFINNKPDYYHTIDINKDIVIEHWYGYSDPDSLLKQGYRVNNCNSERLYYLGAGGVKSTNKYIFNNWRPSIFFDDRQLVANYDNFLGTKFQIWCDDPDKETETQIALHTRNTLRLFSEVIWNSSVPDTNYENYLNTINKIGIAPGAIYPDNPIPKNLSFGKKVFASSVEKNKPELFPEFAIDGDYTTRWSSAYHDSEWICIDLGKSAYFDEIKIYWEYAYASDYLIQVSEDSSNWTTLRHIEGNTTVGFRYHKDLNAKGRFVRIYCLKRASFNGNSLYEFEIFDNSIIDDTIPLKELKQNMVCYPNPVNEILNIYFIMEENGLATIELYDLLGNELAIITNKEYSLGPHNITWGIPNISAGQYYCKFSSDFGISIKQVMIMK